MKYRGEITVFLSLVMVCGIVMVLGASILISKE